jgi:hypothetical protein
MGATKLRRGCTVGMHRGRTLTCKGRPRANRFLYSILYLSFEIMYFSSPFPYVIFSIVYFPVTPFPFGCLHKWISCTCPSTYTSIFVLVLRNYVLFFAVPLRYKVCICVLSCYSFPVMLSAQIDFLYLSLYLY